MQASNAIYDQEAVQKFLCEYILPDDKSEALVKYIAQLRKKFPNMKSERIFKKAAVEFKLQKINHALPIQTN